MPKKIKISFNPFNFNTFRVTTPLLLFDLIKNCHGKKNIGRQNFDMQKNRLLTEQRNIFLVNQYLPYYSKNRPKIKLALTQVKR